MFIKTYEMRWRPGDCSMGMQVDIIQANSMEEATRIVESKAKALGVKNIGWYGKREITKY